MLDRLISYSLLSGMGACFAWTVAQDYAYAVNARLSLVLHALERLN